MADETPSDRPARTLARPLVPLAAAFALGVALQPACGGAGLAWAAAAGLLLLGAGALAWGGWTRASRPLLVLGFAALGGQAMGLSDARLPPQHIHRLPEALLSASVELVGWVAVPPDPRPPEVRDSGDPERTRFVAEVTRLRLGDAWYPATGRARLTVVGPLPPLDYGEEVRGTFRLRHPRRFDNPGAFDYPAYLATQDIFLEGWSAEPLEVAPAGRGSPLLAAIFRLRAGLLRRFDAALPPAQAALLKAAVLGDRSGLTPAVSQAFLDSGTYHILAISGLNVSLLAGALFGLFRICRVSRRVAAAAAALLITGYAGLAGAGASVIRAVVMADVYLLAVVLDRRADLLNSLALSALALLWWNPRYLADAGFQLTFLATLGIVLILPRAERALARVPRPLRWLAESVAMTIAATAMTAPVLAATFNRLSPVGLLANIPIVPLSGLLTTLGTATGVSFLLGPGGIAPLTAASGWVADLLVGLAAWFAAWPGSSVRVFTPTAGMALVFYAGLACLLAAAPAAETPRRVVGRMAPWGAAVAALLLAWQIGAKLSGLPPGSGVRLHALDVGQGQALLLESAGVPPVLVDGGSLTGRFLDLGGRVIAPLLWHAWAGRLEIVVVTHDESDHTSGLPSLLRTVPVGEVWTSEERPHTPFGWWLSEYLRHRRIPHRVVTSDSPPRHWGEAVIQVLHPPPRPALAATSEPASRPNALSLVLRVAVGDQAALLTGDIGREEEASLLACRRDLAAGLLLVPHHGSRQASSPAFLDAVRPGVAVLSVGQRNPFRHPHPEVVARYRERGIRLLATSQAGAITANITPEGIRAWGRRGGTGEAGSGGVGEPGEHSGRGSGHGEEGSQVWESP
jgi:competence protein ComEC